MNFPLKSLFKIFSISNFISEYFIFTIIQINAKKTMQIINGYIIDILFRFLRKAFIILNIITPKRIKAIIKIIGKKCNFIKT